MTVGLADRRARAVADRARRASARLSRGLDGARRRHGGQPLRPRLRHARPHLRRRRAPADHRADARRRLCLDRELAGDAFPDRSASAGAAPISSMPRCWRLSAAPLHAFALPRSALRSTCTGDSRRRASRPRCCRRTALPSCWWRRPSPPTPSCRPACRRICWRSSRAPASMPAPWCGSARCSARRRSARG